MKEFMLKPKEFLSKKSFDIPHQFWRSPRVLGDYFFLYIFCSKLKIELIKGIDQKGESNMKLIVDYIDP